MSWVDLPATGDTDWTRVEFLNQFVKAMNERESFSQTGQFEDLFDAGDQAAQAIGTSPRRWLERLQDTITFRAQNDFIDSVNNAEDFLDGEPDGTVPSDFTFTKADFFAAVNGGGDWTRKYPDANGVTQQDEGVIQAGDYIGPWIWNELQAALKLLVWTFNEGVDLDTLVLVEDIETEGSETEDNTSWSSVKSAAESNATTQSDTTADSTHDNLARLVGVINGGNDERQAELDYTRRVYKYDSSRGRFTRPDGAKGEREIDPYLAPRLSPLITSDTVTKEFDSLGQSWFTDSDEDKMKRVLTIGPTATDVPQFEYGDENQPVTWPSSNPAVGNDIDEHVRGHEFTTGPRDFVIRADVPNGFQFQ